MLLYGYILLHILLKVNLTLVYTSTVTRIYQYKIPLTLFRYHMESI